jgi:hypothetical protein
LSDTPPTQNHAADHHHRAKERRYWTWQTIIGVSAVFISLLAVGITTAGFYVLIQTLQATRDAVREAHRQADITRDAYLTNTRAWMDVAIDTTKLNFSWKPTVGVYMTIALIGTNNGNSPALNASIFARAFVAEFITSPASLASEACVIPEAFWGNITFVKAKITATFPLSISWDDITRYQEDIAKYHLTGEDPDAVPFYVIACAQYKIIGDEKVHHTARVFNLARISATGGKIVGRFPIGEPVPNNLLSVSEAEIGDYAD